MKILLIEPAKSPLTIGGEDYHVFEPLALEYLAAPLLRDHDVRILDQRLERDVLPVLEQFSPDVVGLTAYTVHVGPVRRLCRRIRSWNPEVLIVVGGHHATVAPEDFGDPGVDLIVSGDGVVPFREIVRRRENGQGFEGIPGVATVRDGRLIRTPPAPPCELDSFPYPARRLTAKYRGEYYSEWLKPLASLRTSRGCPFRCNFCALWKVAGGRYLRRAPEKVVEELAGIEEECVFFADDESLVDTARMTDLAGRIRASGIRKRYFLYGRSDTVARHPELLEAWRAIGLERVFVGFESFRQQDLKSIGKKSTLRDNESAVRILHDLDVEIYASFIVRPEFTREDFLRYREYCRGLDLRFASFAVLTPFPGTDFYEEVKDRLLTRDTDFYDLIHTVLPTRLPLKEFYREYQQLAMKYISPRNGMALMRKFPLREWPRVVARSSQWYRRLRGAYLDYETAGVGGRGSESTASS